MEVRRFTDISQIKEIYQTRMQKDFPENELTPFIFLKKMWSRGEYEGYGLYEDTALLGYALFIKVHKDGLFLYLLDYFAIDDSRRGAGLGSFFLKELSACIEDASCIIGEVEDPEKAEDEPTRLFREKRLQFYLRNGYYRTAVTATVNGADYRLIERPTGAPHTAEQIRDLYISMYEHMAPKWFLDRHFTCDMS